MKRALLIAGLLGLVAVAGLGIFLATFDADRYRPLAVKQLESALGKPVRLERLSLGWHGGLALQLNGFAVFGDPASLEPTAQAEQVSVTVRLLPLLRRQLQIASVAVLRPRLVVVRRGPEAVEVGGIAIPHGRTPAVNIQAPAAGSAPAAAALSFFISSLDITDGQLRLRDVSSSPTPDVAVNALDIALRNVSLTRPVGFRVSAAVFSEAQNVRAQGRFQLPQQERPGLLEEFRFQTDLSRLNVEELASAVPAAGRLGLRPPLSGELRIDIKRLVFDPQSLAGLTADVRLTDGTVSLAQFGRPVERLTVEATAGADRITLTQCSARIAGGTVRLTGAIERVTAHPSATIEASVEQIALDQVGTDPGPNQPRLLGVLNGSFAGSAQGLAWPEVSRSLSGQGRLTWTEARIENLNVLRELFQRLSILPGLLGALQARLPPSYQARLDARDTVLHPVELQVTAADGALHMADVQVETDDLILKGVGRIGLDGALAIQAAVWIDPDLSAAVIGSVNELQSLADAQGRLELPVVVQGTLPRVAVLPDLGQIGSRLVVNKAQELIGGLLQRALEKHLAPQEGAPAPSSP